MIAQQQKSMFSQISGKMKLQSLLIFALLALSFFSVLPVAHAQTTLSSNITLDNAASCAAVGGTVVTPPPYLDGNYDCQVTDLEIPSGFTLTSFSGDVAQDPCWYLQVTGTLENHGTIVAGCNILNYGNIENYGSVTGFSLSNCGTINNYASFLVIRGYNGYSACGSGIINNYGSFDILVALNNYCGSTITGTISGTVDNLCTQHTTSTTVSPSPSSVILGNSITYTVEVTDTGTGVLSYPTGTVTWSDGGEGGAFTSTSCTLSESTSSSSTCLVTYTPFSSGTVTITATYGSDTSHLGSSGTSSLTVQTPEVATQSLVSLVSSYNFQHGAATSLTAKLNSAIDSLNNGNTNAAINQLNAFINEINAQTGKNISPTPAQQLISAADSIISALSS